MEASINMYPFLLLAIDVASRVLPQECGGGRRDGLMYGWIDGTGSSI
jgi:hypothetical protein